MVEQDDALITFVANLETSQAANAKFEKDVKAAASKAGQSAGEDFGSKFSSSLRASFAAKATAIFAGIGAALFSKAAIDSAIEAEQAVQRFNNALGRTGQFTREASDQFIEFADNLELSTGNTAESVLDAASQIQNLARLSVPQLERSTKAALDLARALDIDLNQAATLIGKAANGQSSALSRLGIEFRKGSTDAQTFANVLSTIESRFGGASAANLNTFAGALTNFQNSIGKIPEEFGKLTTQSPKLIALLNALANEFSRLASGIAEFGRTTNSTDKLVQSFVALGGVIINFVVRPLEFVGRLGVVVFRALQSAIQQVVANVGRLGNALGTVLGAVGVISKKTQEDLKNFRDASVETLQDFQNKGVEALTTIGDDSLTAGFRASFERISATVDAATGKIEQLPTKMAQVAEQTQTEADKFGPIINSSLVNAVTAGVSRVGAALAGAGDAFSDFRKVIFTIFGDLAIQLGQMLIAKGLAIESLKASLAKLSGGAAIAAGLGLIALGGALKAVGGGSLSASPTVTQADGNAVATPVTPAIEDDAIEETRSRVTVNIQGDVLDSRDTGLRIVELIQDAFDTNGAKVVTA